MEGDWFFLPQMPGQVVWVFGSVENQCISDLGVMGRRGGRAAADMLCGVLVQKELVEDWAGQGRVSGWMSGTRIPLVKWRAQQKYIWGLY